MSWRFGTIGYPEGFQIGKPIIDSNLSAGGGTVSIGGSGEKKLHSLRAGAFRYQGNINFAIKYAAYPTPPAARMPIHGLQ